MEARIGIIGGSGLGQALLARTSGEEFYPETPFGKPSAPLILTQWQGIPIAFLARHGMGHTVPPSQVPYRANIHALKQAGCQWVVASGAVGSLREEIAPRDLVVPDQVIDKTYRRIGTFFDQAAVHTEFAEPFCGDMRQILLGAAKRMGGDGPKVHERGTYVCMEGPAFSTRAESLMHRQWGGDLIGMTAMPEAKLAREAEISFGLIAMATDYDCWRPHGSGDKAALLQEIIGNLHAATSNAIKLIEVSLPAIWEKRKEVFASHRSLELAIWSDQEKISPEEKAKLKLIWGRYLK